MSTADQGGATTISAVHPDIITTQILTRLDGPSLVAATCASSEFHALSSDNNLWRHLCASTWPSTDDPRVQQLISSFPSGHRSFFSDSFPLLHHRSSAAPPPPPPPVLISAVDIFFHDKPIFSRVHDTDTVTGSLTCAPFRVSLVGPNDNESVPIPIRHGGFEDEWLTQLEESLTLSWIVIDPTRRRAADVSSRSPVSVQRQWLTGDVEVRFGMVMAAETVRCGVVVTCGGKEGGDVEVGEVSMHVEGIDGRILNGKDSLVILQEAVEKGERRRRRGQDGKKMLEEYEEMKTIRRRRVQRIERLLDLAYFATALTTFLAFCCFFFFRSPKYIQ